MLPPTFNARVAGARMLAPNVRELVLERDEPLAFEAGQWVSLQLPAGKRSYSIASAPDGTGRFEIAVTRIEGGAGSVYLHNATIGTELSVVGPQGFFTRQRDQEGPTLLVGTGTGVTPLRSILRDTVGSGDTRAMWLLFGIRSEADILYRDELDALVARHPNVRVIYTLSRPHEGWKGRTGWVQTHVRELWAELGARGEGKPHAYICGLHRMVGSVRDVLRKELGAERTQLHSERYD
ncbi:MAG TPA: FAD-dependent oxidoreductase [Polyangiaceae bacterium]